MIGVVTFYFLLCFAAKARVAFTSLNDAHCSSVIVVVDCRMFLFHEIETRVLVQFL